MTGTLKVHAFKVIEHSDNTTTFESLLQILEKKVLLERLRYVGDTKAQLEHIELQDHMWFMDFTRFRNSSGPGKGDGTAVSKPFSFNGDETFCEQTALMYDPKTKYCIVQFNHVGVKQGALTQYFSEFIDSENNIFEFLPKYNEDAMRKFEKRKGLKKLTAKIDTRQVSKNDYKAGTSMYEALSIGDDSGAETIEIVISAGRKKDSFLNKTADALADTLKSLTSNNVDAVDKFEATYVDKTDSKTAALDLLGERLNHTFNDLPLDQGRRISKDERYKALKRAFKSWKAKGYIK